MCFLPALSENSTSTDKSVSSHDDIKLKRRQKQINFFTVIVVYDTKHNKTLPDLFLLMSLVYCLQRSKGFQPSSMLKTWEICTYLSVWCGKPVCAIFEQSMSRSLLPLGMTVGSRPHCYNFSTENDTNGKWFVLPWLADILTLEGTQIFLENVWRGVCF